MPIIGLLIKSLTLIVDVDDDDNMINLEILSRNNFVDWREFDVNVELEEDSEEYEMYEDGMLKLDAVALMTALMLAESSLDDVQLFKVIVV